MVEVSKTLQYMIRKLPIPNRKIINENIVIEETCGVPPRRMKTTCKTCDPEQLENILVENSLYASIVFNYITKGKLNKKRIQNIIKFKEFCSEIYTNANSEVKEILSDLIREMTRF